MLASQTMKYTYPLMTASLEAPLRSRVWCQYTFSSKNFRSNMKLGSYSSMGVHSFIVPWAVTPAGHSNAYSVDSEQ